MTSSSAIYQESFNPLRVLSFDLETTSVNPFEARIVTSALVRIDSSGSHPHEILADPGVEIPLEAQEVHGITTEYAREHGRPHEDVVAETIETIRNAWKQGYTLVVYNAAYDLTVLHQLDPSFLVEGPVYDPYVIDKILDRYRKGKRTLTALSEHYAVKLEQAHNASADALAAARIAWKQATNTFHSTISQLTLAELMERQAVGYYEVQSGFRSHLQQSGRAENAATVNTSWPMQTQR